MWVGHPKFVVVDNSSPDFKSKIQRAIETVQQIVGLPTAVHFYKKYLLKRGTGPINRGLALPPHIKHEELNIEETFMKTKENEIENKLIKRGKHSTYTYTQEIRYLKASQRIEKRRQISAKEYIDLLVHQDPSKTTI